MRSFRAYTRGGQILRCLWVQAPGKSAIAMADLTEKCAVARACGVVASKLRSTLGENAACESFDGAAPFDMFVPRQTASAFAPDICSGLPNKK